MHPPTNVHTYIQQETTMPLSFCFKVLIQGSEVYSITMPYSHTDITVHRSKRIKDTHTHTHSALLMLRYIFGPRCVENQAIINQRKDR